MILPDLQSGHPHPKTSTDAVLPGQAQASQCLRAGRPGPGAPVLSGLWQETVPAVAHPLSPAICPFLLVDSSLHIPLLPNEGPIPAGDYRWWHRWA